MTNAKAVKKYKKTEKKKIRQANDAQAKGIKQYHKEIKDIRKKDRQRSKGG